MRVGYKIVNISDTKPHPRDGKVAPRFWNGLGTRLAPGESMIVTEIAGEIAGIVDRGYALEAIEIDLDTGEEISSPEPEPVPAPEPVKQEEKQPPARKRAQVSPSVQPQEEGGNQEDKK